MIKIIYEDKDLIAINKPAGLLTHPIAGHPKEQSVAGWLLNNRPEIKGVGDEPVLRPGLVHRLDKDTSGVLVIARNQGFFNYLKNLFQKHQVIKTYLALVYGRLKNKGIIDRPIGLKSGTTRRTIYGKNIKMLKRAITEYKTLEHFKKSGQEFSLIRVWPKTGRTHQIRVHLASIGHPIVGDGLYGPKNNPLGLTRQFLHAESIEFSKVNGRRMRIEADLPDDLKTVLDYLK